MKNKPEIIWKKKEYFNKNLVRKAIYDIMLIEVKYIFKKFETINLLKYII